ncbi:hypothetical protein OV079_07930 [Nannocystis pusilla]|uniref:Uncharacterized protein n=1 Tax=Nannocystis pusilla TaxID=889268 RepID=A0A9X3IUT4_9BACT|nr:hypothetical protein [Nannocystis pusilla]MCY1005502.1 hypothetical protein [Nannocystis pusilla]
MAAWASPKGATRARTRSSSARLSSARIPTRGGAELLGIEARVDPVGEAEADEAGGGQQDGVVVAGVELAQAGGHVAAQRADLQGGVQAQGERAAAQAGGAEGGAGRQGMNGQVTRDMSFGTELGPQRGAEDEGVAGVLPRRGADDGEAGVQMPGQVLHAVDGEVDGAGGELLLDGVDEQALAADLVERPVLDPVALGGDVDELDDEVVAPGGAQPVADVMRLPQRQLGGAGSDPQRTVEVGLGRGGHAGRE